MHGTKRPCSSSGVGGWSVDGIVNPQTYECECWQKIQTQIFQSFLQHPKVATCLSWHQLLAEFQTIVHTERAGRACLNPIIL